VQDLATSIRKVMLDPEIIRRFSEMGFEAQNSTVEEYRSFLAAENSRYSKLIRENRIKGE
jgi:tripartite-type tricarboxylate transporter receptor subunit TctC